MRVKVDIIRAEGILALDLRTSDPFAVLEVVRRLDIEDFTIAARELPRTQVHKTATIGSTLSPEWNESVVVNIDSQLCPWLIVSLYDRDFASADDILGGCRLTLEQIALLGGRPTFHDLVWGRPDVKGRILLAVSPLEDETLIVPPPVPFVTELPAEVCPTLPLVPTERLLYAIDGVLGVTVSRTTGAGGRLGLGRLLLSSHRLVFVVESGVSFSTPLAALCMIQLEDSDPDAFGTAVASIYVDTAPGGPARFLIAPRGADSARSARLAALVAEVMFRVCEDTFACVEQDGELRPAGADPSAAPPTAWAPFNLVSEWRRQGVLYTATWRVFDGNRDYALCRSYPSQLVVPSGAADSVVAETAKSRSKARIPVLTWYSSSTSGALCRSSQPKAGLKMLTGGADEADVALLWALRQACGSGGPKRLQIVDARPQVNARVNAFLGGGHERVHEAPATPGEVSAGEEEPDEEDGTVESKGQGTDDGGGEAAPHEGRGLTTAWVSIDFAGIDNIHAVRESHSTLKAAAVGDDRDFFLGVSTSRWQHHRARILCASSKIALSLDAGSPILVHCSDGWDRTSQLVSLAQLMVDPYFRTFDGFQVLVEKDWCSFGHMFNERCSFRRDVAAAAEKSFSGFKSHSSSMSPVFLQWLDCVWHVMQQYPTVFEFNDRFLLSIAWAAYSRMWGNFVRNSEAGRSERHKVSPMLSFWAAMGPLREQHANAAYSALPHAGALVVDVRSATQFWPALLLSSPCASALDADWRTSGGHKDSVFGHAAEEEVGRLRARVASLTAETEELRRRLRLVEESGLSSVYVSRAAGTAAVTEPLLGRRVVDERVRPNTCCVLL